MINKRVNVAKRLKDYKDILEKYLEGAENKVRFRIISNTDFENIAYYKGQAKAYKIALLLFEGYLEKTIIKKERRKESE